MLIGEYTHTLDEKKRISIPSKFRTALGKKVVISNGLDGCLAMYSLKEWEKIALKLSQMSFASKGSRDMNRFILSNANELSIDSAGRVLIPENLCSFANIKTKAVFAGVYNRVEIWDEVSWKNTNDQLAKDADQIAEKLGEIGAI